MIGRMPGNNALVVLHGDQTGEELLVQALRLLEPSVLGFDLDLLHWDLSLAKRRESQNEVVSEATRAMCEAGFGLKAATITPEGAADVGSPNAILRKLADGRVIVRTGRRIPASGLRSPSTPRSQSSAWRWTTPTGPRSGAKAKNWTSGLTGPRR